ncbi:MAG: hypothetical protein RSC28_06610 [Bacteroidales bacterium]
MSLSLKFFCPFLLLILLGIQPLKAQYYLTGEDPARAKWRKIKGENYTVIYPNEIDSLAKKYLWLLESNRNRVLAGLNINPKPIPVVLHPYTVKSNGMVVWTPKRMELYTQPSKNTYSQAWDKQLVLHETRHVGQISHFTKGIYKVGYVIIGEQITGAGVGVYPSKWMMEGDAVVAETELSNSGRGREASFLEYYRASFLDGEYRNWDRWRYGSYKYYTPDIYAFGYLINSTIRYKTGKYGYAGDVLDYFVKRFYNPNVKNSNYKKQVGATPKEYLKIGIHFMDSIWRTDLLQRGSLTQPQYLNHSRGNYYTNYKNTLAVSPDSVFYVKSSYDKPTSLVLLGQGKEKRIRPFDSGVDGFRLSSKGKIYFTETINNVRWQNESFNKLFYYDIATKKIKKLSGSTSYNSPAINSTGDSVAVVEYTIKGKSNITLLNALTGNKYGSIPAPFSGQLTECAWINGEIYAFAVTQNGMGMFKTNIEEACKTSIDGVCNTWERVINEQNMSLSNLNFKGDTLYFSSGIDGVTNLYMYSTQNKVLKRLTNSKYGAYNPSICGNKLYYSQLGVNGFSPVKGEIDTCKIDGYEVVLNNKELSSNYKFIVAEELSRQANESLANMGIKEKVYGELNYYGNSKDSLKVEKYNKLWHLFRFHSWGPIYYNVNRLLLNDYDNLYEVVSLGATLYSQNTLGTAVTMLGYSYYKGFHAGHGKFTYTGLYPVFELKVDVNADDRYSLKMVKNGNSFRLQKNYLSSALVETSLLAYVPFNFSSHGWFRGFTPQVKWSFNNNEIYNIRDNKRKYRNEVDAGLQYYQMRPTAKGAAFPQWGIGAAIRGAFSPNSGGSFGEAGSIYAYGYVPGFGTRHGVKLSVSYQKQFINGKMFYLDNLVDMPRGYDDDDFYGKEYFKASLDYAIPINLGDVHISWLAYLRGLKIIPYADFALMDNHNLYTYGADILIDAYLLHIGAPVSFGVRYGRNGNDLGFKGDKNVFKFLFSLSLN